MRRVPECTQAVTDQRVCRVSAFIDSLNAPLSERFLRLRTSKFIDFHFGLMFRRVVHSVNTMGAIIAPGSKISPARDDNTFTAFTIQHKKASFAVSHSIGKRG